MRVKTISRNPDHYQRETRNDIFKGNIEEGVLQVKFKIQDSFWPIRWTELMDGTHEARCMRLGS